jgi:hypothetical protein
MEGIDRKEKSRSSAAFWPESMAERMSSIVAMLQPLPRLSSPVIGSPLLPQRPEFVVPHPSPEWRRGENDRASRKTARDASNNNAAKIGGVAG